MDELKTVIKKFAKDFYYFCRGENIRDDRSLKELTYLFLQMKILRFQDVPKEYIEILLFDEYVVGRHKARLLAYDLSEKLLIIGS